MNENNEESIHQFIILWQISYTTSTSNWKINGKQFLEWRERQTYSWSRHEKPSQEA